MLPEFYIPSYSRNFLVMCRRRIAPLVALALLQLAGSAAQPFSSSMGLLPECCGSSCDNCCECADQPLATSAQMTPAPTPSLAATCNASCHAASAADCAAWQVILATQSSGKKAPVCSLFKLFNGTRADANMECGQRNPPPPAPTPAPAPR